MNSPSPVEAIFFAALEKATPAEQAAYLHAACGDDEELRLRVERLLNAQPQLGSFLQRPAASLVAPADDAAALERPGTVIGPYKLLEQIAEGGMGLVFMAEQQQPVRRKVALKLVKPGMDSKQVLARFEAERQALAMMDHPHIAKVLDAGCTEAGRPYFVMELVHGIPITDYCDQAQLTVAERLTLFVQVCRAVQHAHQKGIIHRDLKPSNVLVSSHDGVPVPQVIDFGVAKALAQPSTERTLYTGFSQLVGTPLYMSPEQAEFNPHGVDTRSDVYSLGVLLYELLTGTIPFDREHLRAAGFDEFRRLLREEEPPRPSERLSTLGAEACSTVSQRRGVDVRRLGQLLRGELDWIVMKALEKDRNRRYESASALAADVQRYLDDEPVQACPPSAAYRVRKFVRRYQGPVLAVALVLLALAGGMIGTTWGMVRANTVAAQLERAEQAAKRDRDVATAAEHDTKAFSDFLVDHVLTVARPKGVQGGLGVEVTVAQALEAAEGHLEEVFAGRPKAEATARHALGVTWRNLGRHTKAVEHLRRAVELRTRELGPDDRETLNSCNSLAVTLDGLGRTREAIALYEKTVPLSTAMLGPDHRQTLMSLHNLASAYSSAGRQQDALVLHERVLEKQKSVLGPHDPDTLLSMRNLARTYSNIGRVQEALALYKQVLEKRTATLGPDHPHTLHSMNDLAGIYSTIGRLQEALSLHEQVLAKRKALLGTAHPDTLNSMNSLASAYKAVGRIQDALVLHERVLEKQKATLGANHPDTLRSMNNLGSDYFASSRWHDAIALFQPALEKYKAAFGPDHPATLLLMNNLAASYNGAGRVQDALVLHEQVLEKQKAALGPEHADTLATMHNLANECSASGRCQEAMALFEETWRKRTAILGPGHPHTLFSMSCLAATYLDAGRWRDALPLLQQSLEKQTATLGSDHPDTLRSMNNLARAFLVLGRWQDAIPLFQQLLEKRQARLGAGHQETLVSMHNLAAAFLAAGRWQDAVPLFEQTLEKHRAAFGPDHPQTLQFLQSLAAAYQDADRLGAADGLLRDLLQRQRKKHGVPSEQTAGVLALLGLNLLKQQKYREAEPFLRECLEIRAQQRPDDWRHYQAQSLLGGALLGQRQYTAAEPLLLQGYEGMKQRESQIPAPEKRHLSQAVERLVQLYEATNQPEKARAWRENLPSIQRSGE